MTHADHIEKETTELQLWMLPLILFHLICACFAARLDRLQEMRRTRRLPANWRDHLDRLRGAEWPVRLILAEGARRILAGEPLDLETIPRTDPPEHLLWCPPHSALATQLRIEALTRFHADPEAAIRRHAARIKARETAAAIPIPTILEVSQRDSDDSDSGDSRKRTGIGAPRHHPRILIPPWRGPNASNQRHPNPQRPPARARPHARYSPFMRTHLPTPAQPVNLGPHSPALRHGGCKRHAP